MVGRYSAEGGTAPWNRVGICVGNDEVVEFINADNSAAQYSIINPFYWFGSYYDGKVRRVSLDSLVAGHRYMYHVQYQERAFPVETIVKRALAVLANPREHAFVRYSVPYNNSKHFASYVSTRKRGLFYAVNLRIG